MPSILNSSLASPAQHVVSVKAIASSLGLTYPVSVKEMLKHRDVTKIRKYGVCVVTLEGSQRISRMSGDWYDRVFFDPDGIARFFRKASGGRQYVEWLVLGPINLMTLAEKLALD